jgi:hypothetical protein
MAAVNRAAILAALEALEAGAVGEAADILRDVLRESAPKRRVYRCPFCGSRFRWPGLRDDHANRCAYRPLERSAPTRGWAA